MRINQRVNLKRLRLASTRAGVHKLSDAMAGKSSHAQVYIDQGLVPGGFRSALQLLLAGRARRGFLRRQRDRRPVILRIRH